MASTTKQLLSGRMVSLVDRGVFRGYSESSASNGSQLFTFHWIHGQSFSLQFNPVKQRLTMKNILPNIEYRSFLDTKLRRWFANDSSFDYLGESVDGNDKALPIKYTNRKNNVSLAVEIYHDKPVDMLNFLLRVINELFIYLNLSHVDYLHRNFGLPEE